MRRLLLVGWAIVLAQCGIPLTGTGGPKEGDDGTLDGGGPDDAQLGPDGHPLGDGPWSDAPADGPTTCGLPTDKHNCGACGNDCQGGDCADGTCQPLAIASSQADPRGLALDATYVYWTTYGTAGAADGTIMRRKKDLSAEPEALSTTEDSPLHIVVDATNAYWTNTGENNGSRAVRSCALASCSPVSMTTPSNRPMGLAVDTTNVYYASYDDGSVYKIAIGGTSPSLVHAYGGGGSRAVDVRRLGSDLYGSKIGPPELHRFAASDGSGDVSAKGLKGPEYMALGTALYFTDNGTSGAGYTDGALWSAKLDTTSAQVLTAATYPRGLWLDGAKLYFTSYRAAPNGAIFTCPTTAPFTVAQIAANQNYPLEVAVDANFVWWTAPGAGQVLRLPK